MNVSVRITLFMIGILAIATPVAADVYVGNFAPPSVTVYAPGAVGNAAPVRTISGALTGLVSPESVTVDVVNNELYVTDFFGTAIRVYALGANGNVAPLRTIVDGPNSQLQQPRMVAVDTANNEIMVLSGNDGIRAFPRTASGDAVPLRTIKGANTKLNTGITLVLDPVNNELITNSYDVGGAGVPGILVFSRSANGNVAPLRTIVGARTGFGTFTNYTALDLVNNEIVSQSNNGVGVAVFPRTANGNVAPTRNIAGAATGLVDVTGIVVDNGNNRLLISDDSPNQLRAFARTANGNVAPLLVVAGAATGLSRPTVPALDAAGGFSGVGGVVVLPANPPLPIPLLDPASLALIALGLLALGLARLARRRER